jgi:hypothetical protein
MTEGASKLLRELALLLRRYPPEDFEELARLIGRRDFASGLSHVLVEVAAAGERAQPQRRARGLSDVLEAVRSEDALKYALLKTAQETLRDQSLHPTLTSLIEAIESTGVHLAKKPHSRREDIVRAFILSASKMSRDDLHRALRKLGTAKVPSDLRDWSSIIIPKREVPGAG